MRASDIPNIDLNKVKAELCKRYLWYIVKEFWNEIIANDLVWNWHMKVLCDELQAVTEKAINEQNKENDLIINVPPGTSKTSIVSILGTAWEFCKKPSIRTAVGSYSDDAIKDIADKIRVLVHCKKFKDYFPEFEIRKGQDTKHAFKTSQNGAFYAFTVGGTLTSKHFDILKIDDPLNPKMASSDTILDSINSFFSQTLPTRKVNKDVTPTILIMQRLHENDPAGYLLARKKEKLRHVCLPAELSDITTLEYREFYENGLLDVNRLNNNILDEMKIDLGTRGYSNQFEQSPSATGGNIIKKHWFKRITKDDFLNRKRAKNAFITFFADTAYTTSMDNDPTGIIACCKIDNDLYISSAKKVRLEFPELIQFFKTWTIQNDYSSMSTLRIEPKASGKSSVQQLRRESNLNVVETPSPSETKEMRLNSCSPIIEGGRVYLVDDFWNEDFIDEVCGFPNTKHDEYVDILCYAIDYFLAKKEVNVKSVASMFR